MDFNNKFKTFLKKNNFLPLSCWSSFAIMHGIKDIYRKNTEEIIRPDVGNKAGIYVYKKGKRTLYIGKAKLLRDRIKSHCRASFEEVPGDTRFNTWYMFFSDSRNKGKLQVFWKEVETEKERVIFEKMLQYVLNPEFDPWREQFERIKKREK